MNKGTATYSIKRNGKNEEICLGLLEPAYFKHSALSEEALKVVTDYIIQHGATEIGNTIDPYKAAEKILAEHYGYAKMTEANYTWQPRIRY